MRMYPNDCVRCGYCCLALTCPAGVLYYGPENDIYPCPALTFDDEGVASCELVGLNLVPIGDGCCIKARAFKGGVEYDFSALHKEIKFIAAAELRRVVYGDK